MTESIKMDDYISITIGNTRYTCKVINVQDAIPIKQDTPKTEADKEFDKIEEHPSMSAPTAPDEITQQDIANMRTQQERLGIFVPENAKRTANVLRYLRTFTGDENVDLNILLNPSKYREFTAYLAKIRK